MNWPRRPASSLRDPSGYAFVRGDRVFRVVDEDCSRVLRELSESGALAGLEEAGLLVATDFVSEPALLNQLRTEHEGAEFLEHRRLATLSYPYEWSVSMLADAGIQTLDLQLELLSNGLSLKDGSAYNVQFDGSKPVFIDAASIERPERLDLWFGLGQFQRMFTYPLLMARYRGWDLRSYFLGAPDGRSECEVAAAWGSVERWRPALLLDVMVPALLTRYASRWGSARPPRDRGTTRVAAQRANLSRLRRKLLSLAREYPVRAPWAHYRTADSYPEHDDAVKRGLVEEFFEAQRPERVLDVGCNVGDYSFIAARHGARVVAVDAEHDAVELLYRRLRATPAAITPLVVDITYPTPAVGVAYAERLRFHDRVRADCVLALALMHHLMVTAGLALVTIRDLFWELTESYLIVELVPRNDPMFARLMVHRRELREVADLDDCRATFGERFHIDRDVQIGGSGRRLLFLRKR